MYKLVIVDGPNRGTSFVIHDGENAIGRQPGNEVVLASGKVSKRHCVLVVSNGEIVLKDEGSSNGTFVNGVLTKNKKIGPGDRIGVGDYVLEFSEPSQKPRRAPAAGGGGMGNVVRLPTARAPAAFPGMVQSRGHISIGATTPQVQAAPKDLKSRLIWVFENKIMPYFYGLNQKTEWRVICASGIGVLVVASLLIIIPPLLDSSESATLREAAKRARFMAKELVDRNAPFIANRQETKAELGLVEYEDGVRIAAITDMENRIIAPASRLNSYLSTGAEANFAIKARDRFREGVETGFVKAFGSSLVVAIEPVKIMNAASGKNTAVAMAIVSIDTSLSTLSAGEVGMIYSQALVLTGIIALAILLILYRLSMKSFVVLNEDIDKVLKGEMSQVTHEFKFEELDALWDVINSALQRVPKGGSSFSMQSDASPVVEDYLAPIQMLSEQQGMVVFDSARKIVHLNPLFEEISGIRAEAAIGQDITDVARDQALVALTRDLLDRVQVGGPFITEDFEFSGISYRVRISAFGQSSVKFYVMGIQKVETS